MWFSKLSMSTQQEIGLSLCIKLRLHKWVFIPTLREEDFHYVFSPLHSTPLRSDICPFFCIVFYSNMSHILQHTTYSIFNNKFQGLLMITSRIFCKQHHILRWTSRPLQCRKVLKLLNLFTHVVLIKITLYANQILLKPQSSTRYIRWRGNYMYRVYRQRYVFSPQ